MYELNDLPWTGVAKLAPIGHVLWALESDSAWEMFRQVHGWASVQVDRGDVYAAFRRELRLARISVRAVPLELLAPFAQWGAFVRGTKKSFGAAAALGQFRLEGVLVPSVHAESLITYFTRELEQFGRFSFWPLPEGADFLGNETHIAHMALGYLAARLWCHPINVHFASESDRLREAFKRTNDIKVMIERLESGREWNAPIYYHDAVRPGAYFAITSAIDAMTPSQVAALPKKERDAYLAARARDPEYPRSKVDAELYCLRARLIRLLGWPSIYKTLYPRSWFWEDCRRFGEDPLFQKGMPYDIVEELLSFKGEMESKYPVLTENPLATLA